MDAMHVLNDFAEFLKLLTSEKVEYLLVGTDAVPHFIPRDESLVPYWCHLPR